MNFIDIYKKNFLLYLFFTQFILKGCLFYGIFNNFVFPLFVWLNITPYHQQIYYVLMYTPWTFKPIAGLLIDGVIIFGYKKRFYQLMVIVIIIITAIIFAVAEMQIFLLTTGFFLANLVVAFLDIISESTYTEILLNHPTSGSKIISYVVGLQQSATLIMLIFIGIMVDKEYYYPVIITISILLVVSTVPNIPNMINAEKYICPKIYFVRGSFESKWIVGISVYVLFFSIVYMISTIFADDYYLYMILGSMSVVLILLFFITFDRDVAKTLTFLFIYNTLNPSFNAQIQYYFTNASVIDGYNLSYTFYITILGIICALFGIIGSLSYDKIYANYSFRKIMVITNILTISTTLINVMTFYYRDLSMVELYTLSIIWAMTYGVFNVWQFLWTSIFFSKNCEKGKETIMLSIYLGIFNLAVSLGTYVSDQYYKFYLRFIGSENRFDNFYIYYFLLAFVFPIFLTGMMYKMVSAKSETDDYDTKQIITENNIQHGCEIELDQIKNGEVDR